jgi:hypothetical protein
VVKAIVRAFSVVYHALLALFLIAVSGLALATSPQSLHVPILPWTGSKLATTLLCASIFGLVSVLLAAMGKLRFFFFLWSLAVVVMLVRGFFSSAFRFEPGAGGPKTVAYLIAGAVLALLGAWWQMTRTTKPRRY